MRLELLRSENLRCFETIEYEFPESSGLICGPNGSGKTSLLEAVAIVGLGRSFLTASPSDLVRSGAPGLVVDATGIDGAHGYRSSVQVRKSMRETRIVMDGQVVPSASHLARRIPVLVINSKVPDLLSESPGNRRALIDRTMFHVEQGYIDAWKRFRHALRQRNQIIRRQGPQRESAFWDQELVAAADYVDERRSALCGLVNEALTQSFLTEMLGNIELEYRPGWNRETGLAETLRISWERDCRMGYTASGIHRGDLKVRVDGRPAAKRLSRGQSKAVGVGLICALAAFVEQQRGERPTMLVDDLHAEMDDRMCGQAVDLIAQHASQALYTAIRPDDLPAVAEAGATVFHVEH